MIMRYDDYQSLVKLYKNRGFNFLERKYRRLKKKGHPRKLIRIRKYNKHKTILFDLNPFREFNRKKEKWKNYFRAWYALAFLMQRQLMMWTSVKMWKKLHKKKGIRRVFRLNPECYDLMSAFYDKILMQRFYVLSFSNLSAALSRSRHKRLRRFIHKYIKSLNWDASRKKKRSVLKPHKRLRLKSRKRLYKVNIFRSRTFKKINIYFNVVRGHKPKWLRYKRVLNHSMYWSSAMRKNTLDALKINPSMKYYFLTVLDLSNHGKYRECQSFVDKELWRHMKVTNVKRVRGKKKTRSLKGLKKYNSYRNRKIALGKISSYMRKRPVLIKRLAQYVKLLKTRLIHQVLKYKQIKHSLNVYGRDTFNRRISKRIKRWKYYNRKLRRLKRSHTRIRKLGGTLKNWFVIRLTSRYRKILKRLKKYLKGMSPVLKTYKSWYSWNPRYSNYLFFIIYLYVMRTNGVMDYDKKSDLLQLIFLYSYVYKNNISSLQANYLNLRHWMKHHIAYITHQLVNA